MATSTFVTHYWGNGTPLNLANMGLGPTFESSGSVQAAVTSFNAMNIAYGGSLANTVCQGRTDIVVVSFSLSHNTTTNVEFEPGLFSVGGSTFFRKSQCTLVADCCNRRFTVKCDEHFFIRDKFIDPLDGEKIGLPFNLPFSKPYEIDYDFYRQLTYSGTF